MWVFKMDFSGFMPQFIPPRFLISKIMMVWVGFKNNTFRREAIVVRKSNYNYISNNNCYIFKAFYYSVEVLSKF